MKASGSGPYKVIWKRRDEREPVYRQRFRPFLFFLWWKKLIDTTAVSSSVAEMETTAMRRKEAVFSQSWKPTAWNFWGFSKILRNTPRRSLSSSAFSENLPPFPFNRFSSKPISSPLSVCLVAEKIEGLLGKQISSLRFSSKVKKNFNSIQFG